MPTPNMPATQLQRASSNVDTFVPVKAQQAPQSTASRILTKLGQKVPELLSGATSAIMTEVKADEVRQTNRALANLEPTDDATVAGKQAWKSVDDRNIGSEVIRDLNSQAATFEGSDEEWEDVLVNAQNDYLKNIGGSPQDIDTAAAIFKEGLPKVANTRFKAKQQQDQVNKYRTTIGSLIQATDSNSFTPEQIRSNLGQVIKESGAMGMGREAVRKALVDATITQAGQDDLTLMDYTKELGIFDQEPGLVNAERQAKHRLTYKQQDKIAIDKQGLVDQLKASPYMSFEQFASMAGKQKTAEGLPIWSDKEMRKTYSHAQKGMDSQFKVGNYFRASLTRMTDEKSNPIAFYNLSKKEKGQVIDMFDQYQGAQTLQLISTNKNPQYQQKVLKDANNYKAQWLAENGLTDPKWTNQFNLLETMDASTMEGDKLPPVISNAMSLMDDLENSQGVLQTHASNKAISIHTNFKKNLEGGYNEVQSYQLAVAQTNNPPVKLTAKESKAFNKEVDSTISDAYNHWFFSGTDDLNEKQMPVVKSMVAQRAKSLMRANVPTDVAISKALEEVKDTHTQLSNGNLVYGKRQWISQHMGVRPDAIDGLLDNFPQKLVELEGKAGYEGTVVNTSTPPEEWIPKISPNGIVVFTDGLGARVTRPFTLNEIGGISNLERFKKFNNEQKELREARTRQLDSDKIIQSGESATDATSSMFNNYSNYTGE